MKDKNKTKKQLIDELTEMRQRFDNLCSTEKRGLKTEKIYEHFFNLSNDMLCIAGLDGYFKLLNPAFEKMLGYTEEELCATPYKTLIHPDDREDECTSRQILCDNTTNLCCVKRFRCKDGSYKWLSWTDYTDLNNGLVYAVARDITRQRQTEEALQNARNELEIRVEERTAELVKINKALKAEIDERKKIEKALLESEERYRVLFEESPISLWEKDFSEIKKQIDRLRDSGIRDFRTYFENNPDVVTHYATLMKIVDVNKTAVELYNAKSKEDFLTNIGKIFRYETYEMFRGELCAIAEGDLIHESEGITQKFTGEKNYVAIKWVVPPGYGKTFSKALASIIDVTEHKQKIQMEKKARIMQMKLIQANKMTALGTLVSGVAHEINNPNSFIMTNAALLSDIWEDIHKIVADRHRKNPCRLPEQLSISELREVVKKLLDGINDGAVRIKGITNNLSNLARPDNTGMNGKVDIHKAITASRAILGNQIKNFTDKFSVRCAKDVPIARGNPQQIEQVIINLILNSLQALPDRKCGVRVSALGDKESNSVIIKVKDEGTGISSELYEQIKEPFFTTKYDSGGTGLGLPISYDIIKNHGGAMAFDSKPGKGTTAIVTLPVYNNKT